MVSSCNKFYLRWKIVCRLSSQIEALTGTSPRCSYSSKESDQAGETAKLSNEEPEGLVPSEPTNCCMSGCPNCVWLEYAEKLRLHYIDGKANAREAIEREVQDPNLKAFLLFELKLKEN